MDGKAGTFLVRAADDGTAELVDVADGQVVDLASNPGLDPGDLVAGTVAPDPPGGDLVAGRRRGPPPRDRRGHRRTAGRPGRRPRGAAVGRRTLPQGLPDGELHTLCVPPAETEAAVEAVVTDEATRRRAARLCARRAEVRGQDVVVAVRYLEE